MEKFYDVFVSYSRKNLEFTNKLVIALTELNLQVWFDQNDIPHAIDFQNQIDLGISLSKNFIFIISPDSVASSYCLKEIELADIQGKRIIPALRQLPSNESDLHEKIKRHNWIYADEVNQFSEAVQKIVKVLSTDTEIITEHTFILNHALAYDKTKDINLLVADSTRIGEMKHFVEQINTLSVLPCYLTNVHIAYVTECIFKESQKINLERTKNIDVIDTFLSFAAQGKDFEETIYIKKLYAELVNLGFTIKTNEFDRIGGMDTMRRVEASIIKSTHLLYIITDSTISNTFCKEELELALNHNLQIIPFLSKELDGEKIGTINSAIQKRNWVYARNNIDGFSTALNVLQNDIKSNKESLYIYRKLYANSQKWSSNNFDDNYLLDDTIILDFESKLATVHEIHQDSEIFKLTNGMMNYIVACKKRASGAKGVFGFLKKLF